MVGDSAATKSLVGILEDPDINNRRAAINALCEIGDASAVPIFKRVAREDVGKDIRGEADAASRRVEAYNAIGGGRAKKLLGYLAGETPPGFDDKVVPFLLVILEQKTAYSPQVVKGTARLLGQLRAKEAIPLLVGLLGSPPEQMGIFNAKNHIRHLEVQMAAAEALGFIAGDKAMVALEKCYRESKKESVRLMCFHSMERIKRAQGLM
jgi:HEAT repeat protein